MDPLTTQSEIDESTVLPKCDHCGKSEQEHWLFLHVPSSMKVCQQCLGLCLAADIEENGKGEFEGFEFGNNISYSAHFGHKYQVTNDEYISTGTIAEVVEAMLMKLDYI